MDMKINLRVCPHCEWEVRLETLPDGKSAIRCMNQHCLLHINDISHQTEKMLIRAWNKRPGKRNYWENNK